MSQQINEPPVSEQNAVQSNAAPQPTPADDVEKRIQKARDEEKRRLYAQIEQEKAERLALEKKLAEREKSEKEQKLAQLPPDQQVLARMTELEQRLAQEQANALQREQALQNHVRTLGLVAYRERALQDVPKEIHDFIEGSSEESIDASIDRAKGLYGTLEQRLRSKFEQAPAQPSFMAHQQSAVPAAPLPQNPAFVAQQQMPGAGFPTATNPIPVAEGFAEPDMREMTTEQAVRSGKYGGEMRNRILSALKGQSVAYADQLGNRPRHLSGVTYQQMPNGVMQPQGTPIAPAAPPQMAQPLPQQYAQAPQMPMQMAPQAGDARSEALAAIARTHAGQNPVMGQTQGAQNVLTQAQQFAQQRGFATPAEAFAQRFASSQGEG